MAARRKRHRDDPVEPEIPNAVAWALHGQGEAPVVYDLKDALANAELSTKGDKKALIERIYENRKVWEGPNDKDNKIEGVEASPPRQHNLRGQCDTTPILP